MKPSTPMPKPFYIPREQNRDFPMTPLYTPVWRWSAEEALRARMARRRRFNQSLTRILVPVLLAVAAWVCWHFYVQ